jgi:hypothetical protein
VESGLLLILVGCAGITPGHQRPDTDRNHTSYMGHSHAQTGCRRLTTERSQPRCAERGAGRGRLNELRRVVTLCSEGSLACQRRSSDFVESAWSRSPSQLWDHEDSGDTTGAPRSTVVPGGRRRVQ